MHCAQGFVGGMAKWNSFSTPPHVSAAAETPPPLLGIVETETRHTGGKNVALSSGFVSTHKKILVSLKQAGMSTREQLEVAPAGILGIATSQVKVVSFILFTLGPQGARGGYSSKSEKPHRVGNGRTQ